MDHPVIQPPDIVRTPLPVVFLAGPIQGARDWQADAIRALSVSELGFFIENPRKDYERGTFNYYKQVAWERKYLTRAANEGVALFWLEQQAHETPGRAYRQTTRFELGRVFERLSHVYGTQLVLGMNGTGFGNERYIRYNFLEDQPEVKIHGSLEATCEAALVEVAGRSGANSSRRESR